MYIFQHHLYLMTFPFLIPVFDSSRFSHEYGNWKERKKEKIRIKNYSCNTFLHSPLFLFHYCLGITKYYVGMLDTCILNSEMLIFRYNIPCPYVLSARDYPYRCFRMMKIDKQIILVGELVYMGIQCRHYIYKNSYTNTFILYTICARSVVYTYYIE